MSAAEETPEMTPEELAKAKRRKVLLRSAGALGAVGLGVLGGLLLTPRSASAKALKPPRSKDPKKEPGKSGGGGMKWTPPGDDGDGNSGGGGGSQGPGGGGGTRTNPGGGGGSSSDGSRRVSPSNDGRRTSPTPVGPNPTIDELPDYYSDEWPDPQKFYQVTAGGEDAKGLFNIARRYAEGCLYLAATDAGELKHEAAIEWAEERSPDAEKVREWADYILCVAWNDVIYGSRRVTPNNRRGPHGRGIPLSPIHADNWARMLDGRNPLRNVLLHKQGEVGTPGNVGRGDRKLPLLWMPGVDMKVLWDSDGETLRAAGSWSNGFSYYFPPPVVMARSINDPTDAELGAWGCGEGKATFG